MSATSVTESRQYNVVVSKEKTTKKLGSVERQMRDENIRENANMSNIFTPTSNIGPDRRSQDKLNETF